MSKTYLHQALSGAGRIHQNPERWKHGLPHQKLHQELRQTPQSPGQNPQNTLI